MLCARGVSRVSTRGQGASVRARLTSPARARAPPCLSAAAGARGAAPLRQAGGRARRASGDRRAVAPGDVCRMSFKVSGCAARAGRAGSGGSSARFAAAFLTFRRGPGEPRGEPGTVAIVTGRGWGEAGGGQGFSAASPGRQAWGPHSPAACSEHFSCGSAFDLQASTAKGLLSF